MEWCAPSPRFGGSAVYRRGGLVVNTTARSSRSVVARRMPSTDTYADPSTVADPTGAQGWRQMFAYSLPFAEHHDDYEAGAFWFRETMHWPRPLRPLEAAFLQYALTSLAQYNHRFFTMPSARGLDFRLLHGYCYLSPGTIEDAAEIEERADRFAERSADYYANWDDRYDGWLSLVRSLLARMAALEIPDLPAVLPLADVDRGGGTGRSHQFARAYHDLLAMGVELWQAHFELLNLGYAAYLDLFTFCRSMCPEVRDLQVARMVAGFEADAFRPDQELRRLARAAVDLGVDDTLCTCGTDTVMTELHQSPNGREWLHDFAATHQPWFNYSTGSGFYHDDAVWADHPEYPLAFIRSYIEQLRAGHVIDTPLEELRAEREAVADAFRHGLGAADAERFDAKLALARTVFGFVENHNFYIEHWGMSVLWRKLRELSAPFVAAGFWPTADDIFLLRTDEIEQAMWDLLASWANGSPARGPRVWPAEVARRRGILDVCAANPPPSVLGRPPEVVTEPFTIMLWGITSESLDELQHSPQPTRELRGLAASSGVVLGRARVVRCLDDLDDLADGEVLVADQIPHTWAPVFGRIAAAVTEHGGMMSHTSIVCREYGLPAVTSVSWAATQILTGQLLRVDGDKGTVSVIG